MGARSVAHSERFYDVSTSDGSMSLLHFDSSQVSAWKSMERGRSKKYRSFDMASTAISYGCKKRQQVHSLSSLLNNKITHSFLGVAVVTAKDDERA